MSEQLKKKPIGTMAKDKMADALRAHKSVAIQNRPFFATEGRIRLKDPLKARLRAFYEKELQANAPRFVNQEQMFLLLVTAGLNALQEGEKLGG